MQFAQDVLLFAIEAIVIATLLFITVDVLNWARFWGGYQIPANWQPDALVTGTTQPVKTEISLATASKKEIASQANADTASLPEISDPWLGTNDIVISSVKLEPAYPKLKHLLLLPPAKIDSNSPPLTNINSEINDLVAGTNLNTLKLRQARKIAKSLGIAQKVKGKDQPLCWLKGQIKSKLQQQDQLTVAVIETVRELLAS